MARRAEASLSLLITIDFLFLLLLLNSGGAQSNSQGQKTWCVAKPSSDDSTLLENLNYACSQVDCSILQKGSVCFYPDKLMSHTSIAMNLYYQTKGRNYWNCYFGNSGVIAITDPSFGQCAYA